MMKKTILLISILSLLHVSCTSETSSQYTYRPPESINDGFDVGSLEEVNVDPAVIEEAVNAIRSGKYKEVHSILLFKDNRLVFEEYFKGHKFDYESDGHHGELVIWDRTMLHKVMSVTKSICSACVGIAVDKGFIKNIDETELGSLCREASVDPSYSTCNARYKCQDEEIGISGNFRETRKGMDCCCKRK